MIPFHSNVRGMMKKEAFFFYLVKNEMGIFSFTSNNIQCAFIGFIHDVENEN